MRNHTTKAILLGAMLLASAVAHAQYAWIDEKGVRQYSDQPPPTSTPASKILKTPRGMALPATEAAAPAPAPTPVKAPPTLAEREADYKKRHADADDKAATDKKIADTKRTNCEAAAKNKAVLESGGTVRGPGNAVLAEADKAKELANMAAILKDCK
jgi:hypothetical protein